LRSYTAAILISPGRLIGALALLCLLMALAPAAASAGSISGTVTDAETLKPVEEVEVCAWLLESEEGFRCTETDAAGAYELEELAEGEYAVEFWASYLGYATQFYDDESNWEQADPVVVGSEPVTGIDAALRPRPGITGTVTRSSDGEPVEEVEVCAYPVDPKVEETFSECGYTQADGTYYVELEPGKYKVEFWPGGPGQNLAFQFYNGRTHWSEADAVVVKPGERTGGIDAGLEPGATISGTVSSAAGGVGLEEIPVCSIDSPSGELLTCNWTAADGSYALRHLPGDQYKVVFSIDFSEWFGEPVFLGEDDGFATQFWNNQTTLAAANVIALATGQSVSGIDARIGSSVTPPVIRPITPVPTVHHPRKRCRRGYVRKKVKGRMRCVKRHHRHRRHGSQAGRPQRPLAGADLADRPRFRVAR
jgi:hypothetical protein